MSIEKIQESLDQMEPEEAVSALSIVVKRQLPLVEEDKRIKFVLDLVGEPSDEKLASLVHL